MQKRINQTYSNLAEENQALIAPIGKVWERVRSENPTIELYADESHPNLTGTYLIACVFYATFFQDDVADLMRKLEQRLGVAVRINGKGRPYIGSA